MCDVRDSTKSLRWNSSVSSLGQLQKSTHVTLHRSHARDHLGVVKSEHGLWTAQPPGSDTGLLPSRRTEGGSRSALLRGLFGNFLRIYFKGKNFKQLYKISKTDPPLHKRLYD